MKEDGVLILRARASAAKERPRLQFVLMVSGQCVAWER